MPQGHSLSEAKETTETISDLIAEFADAAVTDPRLGGTWIYDRNRWKAIFHVVEQRAFRRSLSGLSLQPIPSPPTPPAPLQFLQFPQRFPLCHLPPRP